MSFCGGSSVILFIFLFPARSFFSRRRMLLIAFCMPFLRGGSLQFSALLFCRAHLAARAMTAQAAFFILPT
jgi:hypothetical protein